MYISVKFTKKYVYRSKKKNPIRSNLGASTARSSTYTHSKKAARESSQQTPIDTNARACAHTHGQTHTHTGARTDIYDYRG